VAVHACACLPPAPPAALSCSRRCCPPLLPGGADLGLDLRLGVVKVGVVEDALPVQGRELPNLPLRHPARHGPARRAPLQRLSTHGVALGEPGAGLRRRARGEQKERHGDADEQRARRHAPASASSAPPLHPLACPLVPGEFAHYFFFFGTFPY